MPKDSEDNTNETSKALLAKRHTPQQSIETSAVEIEEDIGCAGCLHAIYAWIFLE